MPTLTETAAAFDLTLTADHESAFALYARELASWNARMNLTAITDEDSVRVRHFLDSLSVTKAHAMRPGMRVIDVGTGAGFPGLPLKMVYPDLHLTLLEATGKKIGFLDHLIALFGLTDVVTLHARAEDAGHMQDQRGAYDLVLARAVARLPILLEYLLPFAKVGGQCIAMKGKTAHEEADDSAKALSVLGGRLHDIVSVQLPQVEETHYLIVVEKIAPTPPMFPRKPGIPGKTPIV